MISIKQNDLLKVCYAQFRNHYISKNIAEEKRKIIIRIKSIVYSTENFKEIKTIRSCQSIMFVVTVCPPVIFFHDTVCQYLSCTFEFLNGISMKQYYYYEIYREKNHTVMLHTPDELAVPVACSQTSSFLPSLIRTHTCT